MKTLPVFTLLLFVSVSQSLCQSSYRPALQKGAVISNGSMALSFGKTKVNYTNQYFSGESEQTYSAINVSPKIGVLVVNGFMVGLTADLNSITTKNSEEPEKVTTQQYLIGPALRYYAPGGFLIHADIGFGKNVERYNDDSGEETNDARVVKWQAGMGYAFFVRDNIAIEPSFSYRKTTTENDGEFGNLKGSLGEFVAGVGFTVFLHKRL